MNKEIWKKEAEVFSTLRDGFLEIDPVRFIESRLSIDGESFNFTGTGWKPMGEIYRHVGLEATQRGGKPVVICKGRQVGATIMCTALDLYFTNSNFFPKPPQVLHAFPDLPKVKRFSKSKLDSMIQTAKNDCINKNKRIHENRSAADNLTCKQFKNGTLWIDAVSGEGDRIRGMSVDVAFFDECFPYNQCIETEDGKEKIGVLYEDFCKGYDLPLVKSFNEETKSFEYKQIKNAWHRGKKKLVTVISGRRRIKCTENHRFLTTRGWVPASKLCVDDILVMAPNTIDDSAKLVAIALSPVAGVAYTDQVEDVYDIEVEDNHNFIITSRKSDKHLGGPVVHNCQDMFGTAIRNAKKTLTASKYGPITEGVQVFFGTPKERNSYFHTIWELSDQRFYHLGCKNCKKTYPFYQPDDDSWKEIWLHENTVQCPLCGCQQSKIEAIELGEWVANRPTESCEYVGYHINQMYIPYVTKEAIIKMMPEHNPDQSIKTWKNEVLGEFHSAGEGTVPSRTHIYSACRDPDRAFATSIDPRHKTTYLGCDWGHKIDNDNVDRGQSYSCMVVLSSQPDGTLLIEHAHKLQERGYNYKVNNVHEMFRRFGIKRAVSDFYFGQDVVNDLIIHYQGKFLGAQGNAGLSVPVKFREEELMVSYHSDLILDEVFDLIWKGKIRFPWESYDKLSWLIDHCVSMDAGVRMVGGQPIKKYKKGSIPNDGLMALLYAYLAYKFDQTDGFVIKPGTKGPGEYPAPVVAHLPKMRI